MMKKRVMSIVLAAMLAVGGSAFAKGDKPKPPPKPPEQQVTVDGTYTAAPFAGDYAVDYDVNDKVEATGGLQMNTTVETEAKGANFALQFGEASGYADVDVYANNWDNGLSSGAYAEASFNGRTEGFGFAMSGFKDAEAEVSIESSFSGVVEQAQTTREVGYQDNQGIAATNFSKAEFSGVSDDSDKAKKGNFAFSSECDSIYTRGTEVTGRSFVSIDPYGNTRSYEGMTTSDARIGTSDADKITVNKVTGAGEVGALVQKAGAGYAAGNAGYTFTGQNAGIGAAQISGSMTDGGSYSTAQSSGSSFAIVGGGTQVAR